MVTAGGKSGSKSSTGVLDNANYAQKTQAGIPRSQWNAIDRTGIELYEEMLSGQLS